MAISTTQIEANLTTKLNATTGTTEGKEFLLLGKAVEALTPTVTVNSVITEGTTQVARVTSEGTTQVAAVQAAAAGYAPLAGATFTGAVNATDLTLSGNLTVNGTTTTVNSTTLDVADLNITVASGAADAAAANGAGITVDGASATMLYTSSTDTWNLNKDLIVNTTGALTVPDGTTAQRPSSPSAGAFRFNTEDTSFEGYDGSAWAAVGGGSGGLVSRQVFTSSGTWTRPAGVTKIKVIGVGGGGSGGESNWDQEFFGGGGGSGGYFDKFMDVSSLPSVAVTIGAGAAGQGGFGQQGGNTTFGSYCTGEGGSGGKATYNSSSGGEGGAATGGDINIRGGGGGAGAAAGNAHGVNFTGQGGASFFGGGSHGCTRYARTSAPAAWGSGGSGGAANGSGSQQNGNAGQDGIVIIEEYS